MARATDRAHPDFLACVLFLGILAVAPAAAQVAPELQQQTVMVAGQPIAVWSRSAAHPQRTVLLVHGATWSALPDFDLQVPGEQRSILAALAARGYAAYAVDLRGYGRTPRDRSGWLTPSRAAADVAAVLTWIARQHPTLSPPALLGWSNGALVAQLVAQQRPALVSRLILYGSPWTPGAMAMEDQSPVQQAPHIPNDSASAASDFIVPGSISATAVQAYILAALRADPVRAEWRRQQEWNTLDAAKLKPPTLVLYGEHDPLADDQRQENTFRRLRSPGKAIVVLKGGDHAALLENTVPGFVDAVTAFLERPLSSSQPHSRRQRN